MTVPAKAGMLTVKGADNKNHALRVAEMRKWLPHALGKTVFDLRKNKGVAFEKTTLTSWKGIDLGGLRDSRYVARHASLLSSCADRVGGRVQ